MKPVHIFLLLVSLAACTQIDSLLPKYSSTVIKSVSLIMSQDANQNSALAADIVFIFDETLANQLGQNSARQWFANKEQLQNLNPKKLVVFNFELVPGAIESLNFSEQAKRFPQSYIKASRVLAFANYIKDSKENTIDIGTIKSPILSFGADKASISGGA